MNVTKSKDDYLITIEEGEDPKRILAAIIVASVEFSYPLGGDFLKTDPSLTLQQAEEALRLEEDTVIDVDYIGRNLCKTRISKTEDPKIFKFAGHTFSVNRGDPMPMFLRAEEILNPSQEQKSDYRQMQRGVGLDLLTAPHDLIRKEGESDEKFIKRIFIPLYKEVDEFAMQITFGMKPKNWAMSVQGLVTMAGMLGQLEDQTWIDGFACDPIWI